MKKITLRIPKQKEKAALKLIKKIGIREVTVTKVKDLNTGKQFSEIVLLVTDSNVNPTLEQLRKSLDIGKSLSEGMILVEGVSIAAPVITEKKAVVAPETKIKETIRDYSKLDKVELSFLILATIIASLGMLINNFYIVIGAMLIAPIMNPMISASFGFSNKESKVVGNSLRSQLIEIALAIGVALFIGFLFSTISTPTLILFSNNMLVYFLLAVVIGITSAFAFSSEQVLSFVGVAVAVTLLPPLVVIGLAVPFGNSQALYQALKVLIVNWVGIHIGGVLTFSILKHKV